MTSSHQTRCRLTRTSRRRYFQVTGSPPVKGNVILHTPVSPRLPHSSSFSPIGRLDPPPSFTSTRFNDGILLPPHFATRLPSPSSLRRSRSFPRARVRLNSLLLHLFLVRHPRPLGRIPFPFLLSPLPSFLHLLLIRLLSSRLFLFLPHPSHPSLRFLRHFTLFFFTFVKSHNVLYHVLS